MRSKLVVLGLLLALAGAACGSRLPDQVLERIDAGSPASNSNGGPGSAPSPGSAAASAADQGSTSPGPAARSSSAGVDTGTQASSGAGPSESSGSASSGPSPGSQNEAAAQGGSDCASLPAKGPGITDKEITVASIVTDSGPLPGATEGAYRATASYAAMINSQGGLCGRKLTVLKGDDGLDPAKARAEFLRLEPKVFAFVGSYAVADSGYIDLIKKTGVPYVALVVDPAGRDAPNVWPKTASNYVDTGPFVWLKQKHPDVKKAALLYADVGGVSANIPGYNDALEHAGFDRLYTDAAQVTNPDYTAEVRKAQDAGVQMFFLFAFEVNMHVRMVRSMRQQNYDPPIKLANIGYNSRFSELLGKDGDGWENFNTHLQFLDPNERKLSKDLGDFLDWNHRLFPGGSLDLFPVSGWGRSALFVQAMRGVQGEISRQSLIDSLGKITQFDGGGIEAPLDPRTGLGKPCWNMALHSGGHWVREYPTDGRLFECNIGENYKFK